MTNSKVVRVNSDANLVETQDGETYNYDYLVLASGGSPRSLDIAKNVPNVYLLRTPEDGNAIGMNIDTKFHDIRYIKSHQVAIKFNQTFL